MTPDAFLNDWYGYATNQMGHFFLGMALVAAVMAFMVPARVAVVVVMAGCSVHEIADIVRGGLWWDGVEDAAFVTLGAVFVACGWRVILLIASIVLAVGVAARARK